MDPVNITLVLLVVAGAVALFALWLLPSQSIVFATAMLAVIGVSGSTFPVLIAHAKAVFPAHLTGRGVTLMNLFGIGGVGVMQFATGPIYLASQTDTPSDAFSALFGVFAIIVTLGLLAYLWSADRTD
mgnify:CR=1 FL=1